MSINIKLINLSVSQLLNLKFISISSVNCISLNNNQIILSYYGWQKENYFKLLLFFLIMPKFKWSVTMKRNILFEKKKCYETSKWAHNSRRKWLNTKKNHIKIKEEILQQILNEMWAKDNIAQRKGGWVSHDATEDKLGTRQETRKPASLWIHNICIKVGRWAEEDEELPEIWQSNKTGLFDLVATPTAHLRRISHASMHATVFHYSLRQTESMLSVTGGSGTRE